MIHAVESQTDLGAGRAERCLCTRVGEARASRDANLLGRIVGNTAQLVEWARVVGV